MLQSGASSLTCVAKLPPLYLDQRSITTPPAHISIQGNEVEQTEVVIDHGFAPIPGKLRQFLRLLHLALQHQDVGTVQAGRRCRHLAMPQAQSPELARR